MHDPIFLDIVVFQGSGVSIKNCRPSTDKGHPLPFSYNSLHTRQNQYKVIKAGWVWHATIFFYLEWNFIKNYSIHSQNVVPFSMNYYYPNLLYDPEKLESKTKKLALSMTINFSQ